ncbi:MAG: hypothetical protein PHD33_04520 [Atribacterota bacterium]|nr:hypothetical protein [Atribacterota bacterium]
MTNWTNISTFEDMIFAANQYSPFWSMMLFMLWAVLVITFIPFGIQIAIIGGSFLAGITGLFLAYMGVVSWKWVLGLFAITIFTLILETFREKKD